MSSASNIYNLVGNFYGWRNMPETSGVFFGFANMTKNVMIDAMEALRANSAYLNFKNDSKSNRDFWFNEAYNDLVKDGKTGGASKDAFIKWFNWLYLAAAGNETIKEYFGGKPYSLTDYVFDTIKDSVTGAASSAAETIEYGMNVDSAIPDLLKPTTSNFWKWLIIGGATYFVLKKL